MSTSTRTSTSGLDRKLAAVQAEMRGAALELVRQQAGAFVRFTQLAAPRDTNRYVRGWAQAGNAAGVVGAPFAEAELQPSKYRGRLIFRLELQVADYERLLKYWRDIIENRYKAQGRTGKWLADAEKQRNRTQRRLERAQEELQKFQSNDYALVIFRKQNKSGGLTVTTREQVKGGTGSVEWAGDRPFILLHNREPHASIVEKQHRVVARGRVYAKTLGGQLYGRSYLARLAKAGKA